MQNVPEYTFNKCGNDGHFTVRRHNRKWSGVWTDMNIEQTLMKCTKSRKGITHGGGMTESQRALWILSHSRSSEITYAMSLLTSVFAYLLGSNMLRYLMQEWQGILQT